MPAREAEASESSYPVTSAIEIGRAAITGFLANGALSRGAAISFYAVTSLAPVLLIVVAVAGLAFGRDAVREGLVQEIGSFVGSGGSDLIHSMLVSASDRAASITAATIGFVMVVVTASGVFGEMQSGLNATWKVTASKHSWFSLLKARAVSLGLVAALGFLLMVSLAVSASLTALSARLGSYLSGTSLVLSVLNLLVSLGLFTFLFGAIYRTLPDAQIAWRDVATGALITAVLFTGGKAMIGWYLGAAAPGSAYGAAGAPILVMLWVYYSAQILLFGAEITKSVADRRRPAQILEQ